MEHAIWKAAAFKIYMDPRTPPAETGLLENGAVWMDIVQSRNLTSHTYDEAIAARIAAAICDTYLAEFDALRLKLEALKKEEEG